MNCDAISTYLKPVFSSVCVSGDKKRPTIRELLNEAKWTGRAPDTEITFVDRGSPGDEATVCLDDVEELGTLFMFLDDGTMIPYHRVRTITVGDSVVLRR